MSPRRNLLSAASALWTHVLSAVSNAGADPLRQWTHLGPASDARRAVTTISEYRDWLPADCLGSQFPLKLPSLRQEAASVLE